MKPSKLVVSPDMPAIKKYLDDAVARAIAKTAVTIADLREWCDKSEAAARAEPLEDGCSCLFDARMQLIDEVRSLLPPLPDAGEAEA